MIDTDFEHKQTFGDYYQKVKTLLKKDYLPELFRRRMFGYFVDGLTPKQAIEDFCRNQNTELEREINQAFNQVENEK